MQEKKELTCHNCGAILTDASLFCGMCGAPVDVSSENTVPTSPAEPASVSAPVASAPMPAYDAPILKNDTAIPAASAPAPAASDTTYKPADGPVQNVPAAFPVQKVDGIGAIEFADYAGSGKERIMNKFSKFFCGSKSAWNWPVFLFGFFLGMPFIWFFYRKMYKVGTIVLAISVLLSVACLGTATLIASAANDDIEKLGYEINITLNKYRLPKESVIEYFNDDIANEKAADDFDKSFEKAVMNIIRNKTVIISFALMALIRLLGLIFVVTMSLKADYLYYKKALKDLKKLHAGDAPVTPYLVSMIGGRSVAAAVWSGIFTAIALSVVSAIVSFMLASTVFETIGIDFVSFVNY